MNALSILIKPASSSCNLRCSYCFYHDIADHRSVKSFGRMKETVRKELIRKAFTSHARVVSFAFQGGEPTLAGLDFFKSFVKEVDEYNVDKIPVHYSLQTNGYTLNEDWVKFLKGNRFLVGVSLDGPKEIHDYLRMTYHNKTTHKRVMESIRLLERFSVPFNILCVLTSYTARHITKVYNFFKKQGFNYVQYIPCIDSFEPGEASSGYVMTPEDYEKALTILFRKYKENFLSGDYVSDRLFDNFVGICLGRHPESCSLAGACSTYFVIEASGDAYPCDFYALDEYKMGNIMSHDYEEMFNGQVANVFRNESRPLNKKCESCEYLALCRGGCKRYKRPNPQGDEDHFVYCSSYQAFFEKHYNSILELAGKVQQGFLSK